MDIDKLSDDARELLAAVLNDEYASRILYHARTARDVREAVVSVAEEQLEDRYSQKDIRDAVAFLYAHLKELNDEDFDASEWLDESSNPTKGMSKEWRTAILTTRAGKWAKYGSPEKRIARVKAASKNKGRKSAQLSERNQLNAQKRRRYQASMGSHVIGAESGDTIHTASGRAKAKFRKSATHAVRDTKNDGASGSKVNLSRAWLSSKKGTHMQKGAGSYAKMDKKARGVREDTDPSKIRSKMTKKNEQLARKAAALQKKLASKKTKIRKEEIELGEGVVRSVKRFMDKFGGKNSRQAKRIGSKALDNVERHGKHVHFNDKGEFADRGSERHLAAMTQNSKRYARVRESVEQLVEKSLWKKAKRWVQSFDADSSVGVLNHHKAINFANKDRATYKQAKRAARFSTDLGDRAAKLDYQHGQNHHREYLANAKKKAQERDAEKRAREAEKRKARNERRRKTRNESVEQLIEKSLWKKIKRAVQAHTPGTAAHSLKRAKNTRRKFGETDPKRISKLPYHDAKFLSTDKWGNFEGGKYKSSRTGRARPKLPGAAQGRM